jgi:hypothetical protein
MPTVPATQSRRRDGQPQAERAIAAQRAGTQPAQPSAERAPVPVVAAAALAGLGAAGAAVSGPAAPVVATTVQAAAVAKATEAILRAFEHAHASRREQVPTRLAADLERELPDASPEQVQPLVRGEVERERTFQGKARERMQRDLPVALAIADPAERRDAVRRILEREHRFERQREDAIAARAGGQARFDRMRSTLEPQGVTGMFWRLNPRLEHCARCLGLAGKVWPWTVLALYPPPRHPNCFPAGTLVSGGRPHGATARWYEGSLVRLCFVSGRELAVTPNHPLLSREGWVAAGEVNVGRYLIGASGLEGIVGRGPEDQQVPARIEDVVLALALRSGVRAVPGAAVDFHGDGREGEVHVVGANGLLRYGLKPAGREKRSEIAVALADVRPVPPALLQGDRALREPMRRNGRPPSCRVRRGSSVATLLGRERGRVDTSLLTRAAQRHALRYQATSDRVAAHSSTLGDALHGLASTVVGRQLLGVESLHRSAFLGTRGADAGPSEMVVDGRVVAESETTRKALDRLAGEVALDEVVEVGRREFRGHVYNLELRDHWYLSNGIVAHNCGCTLWTPQDAYRMGWATPADVVTADQAVSMIHLLEAAAPAGHGDDLMLREAVRGGA